MLGNNPPTVPQSASSQGNLKLYLIIVLLLIQFLFYLDQQIEQTISILKNELFIPKRRNPKSGGSLGRPTQVEVNYLPLNLDKLFKKVVYHVDVQFKPELPKRLLR